MEEGRGPLAYRPPGEDDIGQIALRFIQVIFALSTEGDAAQLRLLFKERSELTFDGEVFHGDDSISKKIGGLGYSFTLFTVDPQPVPPSADLLVFVNGSFTETSVAANFPGSTGESGGTPFSGVFKLEHAPEDTPGGVETLVYFVRNAILRVVENIPDLSLGTKTKSANKK